jgi:tryptophan-rich sensory protein
MSAVKQKDKLGMAHQSIKEQALGLFGWLGASFAAGGLGAIASSNAGVFYGQLSRPPWAPPGWLFGPVWSVLYLLIGLAAWLVWRKHGYHGASAALQLFIVQLIANALWTWLFFEWHLGAVAFVEIVVLWLLIAATLFCFWRLHRPAALLLVPYLAWVSFATALTFALWRLNHSILG